MEEDVVENIEVLDIEATTESELVDLAQEKIIDANEEELSSVQFVDMNDIFEDIPTEEISSNEEIETSEGE